MNLSGNIFFKILTLARKVHPCAFRLDACEIPKTAARVATVVVIRRYLTVMNDRWVRGVGSDTDMDGNDSEDSFPSFPSLVTTPMMM